MYVHVYVCTIVHVRMGKTKQNKQIKDASQILHIKSLNVYFVKCEMLYI